MKPQNNLFPGAIFQDSNGKVGKIITVDARRASIKLHQGGFVMVEFFDKLSPVPLTHDILGMLGFAGEEKINSFFVYEYSPTTSVLHKWTFAANYDISPQNDNRPFGSIQYVHQLQQIYLALHGVLLELK